jgi:hypothetical protein
VWEPHDEQRYLTSLEAIDRRLEEARRREAPPDTIESLEREKTALGDQVPLAYLGVRRQPDRTVLFERGSVDSPGDPVEPRALSAIRQVSADLELEADAPEGERRLRFARWLTDAQHPLTSRVMVNRVWQYHMGRGLVETPSDFGFQAGQPSHPELLDWLANYFIDHGGSVKQLHRLIMLSNTYRQSALWNEQAASIDHDGQLFWRFIPRRLEGESVRDLTLATSGEWNSVIGGPSFQPFTVTVFNTHFYHLFDRDTPEFNRRTIYRANVMTGRSPLLDALDCPCPSTLMPKRGHTVTTLQALSLMNDAFIQRQAERFAQRVALAEPSSQGQTGLAFRLALGRLPSDDEWVTSQKVVEDHGLSALCWTLFNTSEFLYLR